MRKTLLGTVTALAFLGLPVFAGTPEDDLETAVFLMGQLQACLAGGLGNGGITPLPEDMAAVRAIIKQADPLLREAAALARKTDRTRQEDLLLAAYARGSLAMLNEAEDFRVERGY